MPTNYAGLAPPSAPLYPGKTNALIEALYKSKPKRKTLDPFGLNSETPDLAAILNDILNTQRVGNAGALQRQQEALGAVDTGFKNALASTSRLGASARQTALDREKQTLASGQQSLESRGLGNTTALQDLQRSVGSDTNRTLAAIDSEIAGIQSGLQAQAGVARGQGLSAIAALLGQQTGARTSALQALAGLSQNGIIQEDDDGGIGQLLGLGIGGALGELFK